MPIEQLLETLTATWNDQDVDTILSLFADDGAYHEPTGPENLGNSHLGHGAIRQVLRKSFAAFPDGTIVPTAPAVITGNNSVSEWNFEFSAKAGRKLSVHGVDVFTFENGKIKHKNAFLKQYVAAATRSGLKIRVKR